MTVAPPGSLEARAAAPSTVRALTLTCSVVICSYSLERWDLLGAAVQSVLDQTRPAEEVVLVVDHHDGLLDRCRRAWPGVRVLASTGPPGLAGARNAGLAASTGAVVAFMDDDAFAEPTWLERLVRPYESASVVAVGGSVRPGWRTGRPSWFPPEFDWVVGCTHSGMPRGVSQVRNLVGANMSFRRAVVAELGFRPELGRVDTRPSGCEETELCIRVAAGHPDAVVLYEPTAVVEHTVTPGRASLHYFLRRCLAEGRSKAVMVRLVGSVTGLAEERSYVVRTLPAGLVRGVRDVARGDPTGLARAGAIAAGLACTAVGYVLGALGSNLVTPQPRTR